MNLVKRAQASSMWQTGAGLSISDMDRMMDAQYGGSPSYTGKAVSQTTALAVSTLWRCVNAISCDMAMLPQYVYKRIDGGAAREMARKHYLWSLLNYAANPELSSFDFYQLMQAWLLLWGNAYAEIVIDGGRTNGPGKVTALWPWRPDRTKVERAYRGGPLQYRFRMEQGQWSAPVPRERMFHIRGFSLDGILGMSPVEVHKQTIGLNMAMTEHAGRYFSNNSVPPGVLYTDKQLGDVAFERLKANWATSHEGLDNAHRIAILEQGLKWQSTGGDMLASQWVESKKVTQYEIVDMFNMPAHRAGLLDRATNNNIEEQALEYVIYTLGPWAAKWQNQTHCDLLSDRENAFYYTAFDFKNLLRGNHESMAKFIAAMRQWGIMNADECREYLLDMNPQPNGTGKTYWQPVNIMPADGDGPSAQDQARMRLVPEGKE